MKRYDTTERRGVNEVERIVLEELEWIFREQVIVDMGIDAQIERVDGGKPTGQLIAVQIKTGMGNFHETADALTYYGDLTHLDYWSGHSLPVILIAHIPEVDLTVWALVTESTATRTKTGWKISIQKDNRFGCDTTDKLRSLFDGTPAQQRVRRLSIDEPLMRHVAKGGRVSLELEKWVNKSLGRTPVEVYVYDENENETLSREWYTYYVGYDMKELAEALFPWATAAVDADFYEEHDEFGEDEHDRFMRAADFDNGIEHDGPGPDVIYPYKEAAGEIECYRLRLRLNDLGHAFLVVSAHLETGH